MSENLHCQCMCCLENYTCEMAFSQGLVSAYLCVQPNDWCQVHMWTLVSRARVNTGVRCTCGHWCQVHMWTLVSGARVDTGVRSTCGHWCQVHVWTLVSGPRVDTGVRSTCGHWCQVHVWTFDESWDDVIIMHCITAA